MKKKICFSKVAIVMLALAIFSCSITDSVNTTQGKSIEFKDGEVRNVDENGNARLLLGIKDNGKSINDIIGGIENQINILSKNQSNKPNSFIKLERVHDTDELVKSSKQMVGNAMMSEDEIIQYAYDNLQTEEEKAIFRDFKFQVDIDVAEEVIKLIESNDDVSYVQKDNLNVLYDNPNDPYYRNGSLWGLTKTKCGPAWDVTKGESVTVAVIDSGVDGNHPDLVNNLWRSPAGTWGYDFSDNDNYPSPAGSHGTHVAGTIGAVGNNGIGVIGVAPKVKIMAVKIFPNAFDSVCVKAIKYAVDNGAKVLNNSWGPGQRQSSNPTIENAIRYAHSKGAIVIFAAGNENDDAGYYYGGNSPYTICVAAVDSSFRRASFSNYGSVVDIAAPGVSIKSTIPNSSYSNKSGTSMAAPHVAGLAALMLSKNPGLTFNELLNQMKKTAMPANSSNIGAGVIDVQEAVGGNPATDPTMPENFTLTDKTESSLKYSWNASQSSYGISGYRLYLNGNLVKTVNGLNGEITGLSSGTSYNVSVAAVNTRGDVSKKNTRTDKTKGSIPDDEWQPNVYYQIGDIVSYSGNQYKCRQSHTSLPGWDPVTVPSLWLEI